MGEYGVYPYPAGVMLRFVLNTTLILTVALYFPCAAQNNLVPNPSFESYNQCPIGISGLEYSPGYVTFPTVQAWVNPLQIASADYFNTCAAQSTQVSIPGNAFGYQQPRTGNGYVGIIAWEGRRQGGTMNNTFSEYIQCKLKQPLIAGNSYCVTFYVSSGVSNATYNFVGIDAVGVNFSGQKNTYPTGSTISLPYSMTNQPGNFLTDTTNWKMVSAIYKAQGGEEWMTIGWFDNGSVPAYQPIKPAVPNPAIHYRNYLYLEDVSVVEMTNVDTFYTTTDTTICKRGGFNHILESKGQLADYKWSNGVTTPQTSVTDTGTYYCVARAGCITYIDTFKIKYEPAPELDLGKELINCNNQAVTIRSNYPNSNYLWNTGATTDSIIADTSGTYFLTISDHCGTQTDSVHVYIQPPTPKPAATDTMICQFETGTTINAPGENIHWYTHPEGLIGLEQQPPIVASEPGTYNLFITQTIGKCESKKSPVTINVTYTPHEELGDKIVMCDNDLKKIGVSMPDVSYKWNTGSNACCIVPHKDGLYKLAMENQCGTFVDSLWVIYSSCEECIVFPNAFVPVRNHENRVFRPILKCPVSEYHIRIYNRWGNMVFESNDVQDGWYGRFNYDYAPIGTYVYLVEYKAKGKQKTQYIKGNVTLLR